MDREIKFRGWFQGINGVEKWVYGYLVKQTNGNLEITNGETSWTVDNVGQFTGLFDKNGIEIYEGDLVQHDAWNYPFEVIFNDEKARFVCKLQTGLTKYIDFQRLIVVGNVF